ncbi:MAG: hypothetical protein CMJ59_23820 [Planctomycetaceae bacterium]|nr:hypothetical protein [Planctomycetaceae bacterium]
MRIRHDVVEFPVVESGIGDQLPILVDDRVGNPVVWLAFACRAGTTTAYSFGDDASEMGEYAWYKENATLVGQKYAHTVGQKKPNPWGLYDMHGNVWEWCEDWHGVYHADAATDPAGPSSGSSRVSRGGGWTPRRRVLSVGVPLQVLPVVPLRLLRLSCCLESVWSVGGA